MDLRPATRRFALRAAAAGAAVLLVALVAVGAWRWAIQRVNLVIVNQSGVEAVLTWQPGLFAAQESVPVNGCESKSLDLRGGQHWRFESETLDINANFVDRPWLTPTVEFEIWLDPGGASRIVGPRAVDSPVSAPVPSSCTVNP